MQLSKATKTAPPRSQPSSTGSVRSQIANATQQVHEALHVHPVVGRLIAPDISLDEYRAIMQAYMSFYQGAEVVRTRYALMPALSFEQDLECLNKDLGHAGIMAPSIIPVSSSLQSLGMLYVLHGSRFGAIAIYRNLKMALARHEHSFFRQRPDKFTWQSLLARLEEQQGQSADVSEITAGSKKTFGAFDKRLLVARPASP